MKNINLKKYKIIKILNNYVFLFNMSQKLKIIIFKKEKIFSITQYVNYIVKYSYINIIKY